MAVYLDANTAAFNSKLAGAEASLNRFSSTAVSAGKALAGTFGAYQVFNALKEGLTVIADFEAQMSTVKALTDSTGDGFNKLRDDALQLGAATKFTATEVAKLQTEFARLGFSTSEILSATKATIALATATGEDLAKSTVVVGSAIRQFNLPASEANHIADVMAGAFNKTALALDDFGEAMKYVGPAAAAANLTFEQTSSLLGILADSGVKGSQAGTSLRRILTDLAKDGRPLSERLRELASRGISLQNSFDDIGRIASTSLLVLEKGVDRIDPLSRAFANLTGEAERVAAIMQDNLQGDVTKLTASFNNLVLALSGVTSTLRPIVQDFTAMFSALTDERISKLAKVSAIFASIATQSTDPLKALGTSEKILNAEQEKLNNTARAVFLNYAKGFSSNSDAAEKFKQTQYELILAAQIQEDQNRKLFGQNAEELAAFNERLDAEIKGRLRLIQIANEYIRATAPANAAGPDTAVRSIRVIEQEITNLRVLQKDSASYSVFAQYQKQIDHLELELVNIETKLRAIGDITVTGFHDKDAKGVDSLAIKPVAKEGISLATITAAHEHFDKLRESIKGVGNDLKTVTTRFDSVNNQVIQFAKLANGATGIVINMSKVLQDIAIRALVGFGDALGQAFAGGKNIGKTFLSGLVAFLHQFGELLIAAGVASLSLKNLFANPLAAIAAGVGLVAVTSAIATKLNAQSNAAAQTSSSSGRTVGSTRAIEIQVVGETFLKGSDIYVSWKTYNANKNG